MFFHGSRYLQIGDAWITMRDGRIVRYKKPRRITPPAASRRYVVKDPDRPDLAAYAILGDSERFWELCDAAGVAKPSDLTRTPGEVIPVPGPEGLA
ncbi:MAG TPA: hypothetical protein VNT79_09180 [Phycisphaerae bacterium]|jgi:hypothetical protein|nr:hypothetical protein [Phycisphaerae bacterium]